MTSGDRIESERKAAKILREMEGEDFSLAQKAFTLEFVQKKLFPPINLAIGGELKEIPSWQVMVLEAQFAELTECLVKNCKCSIYKWVKNSGSDESIAETLEISYLRYLATPEFIAFLKYKVGLSEHAETA